MAHNYIKDNCGYTEEELMWIERSWGKISTASIAKRLGRKESAIQLKAFRLGLGSMLDNKDYLILSEVAKIMGVDRNTVYKYKKIKNMPFKNKHLTSNQVVHSIEYEDFLQWLIDNINSWDATKVDKLSLLVLGFNQNILEAKIKKDTLEKERQTLSDSDIGIVIQMYKCCYTYQEIADRLNKNYHTIKYRIDCLVKEGKLERNKGKGRLIRRTERKSYGWQKWQDEALIRLFREGKTLKEISEIVGKTFCATKCRNQKLSKLMIKGKLVL